MARQSLPLVCVVLCALAGRAHAGRLCGSAAILPAAGATDVPRNTKIWHLDDEPGFVRVIDQSFARALDVQRAPLALDWLSAWTLSPGELAAGHWFTAQLNPGQLTWFATSHAIDTRPPALPIVRRAHLVLPDAGRGDQAELALDAALDPDVALVAVLLESSAGARSVMIARDDLVRRNPLCGDTPFALSAGERVRVTLNAIDLAGNVSPPRVFDVEVERDAGGGLSLGAIAFLVFGVWSLIQLCWFGGLGSERDAPAPLSLLVAERLARGARRRSGLISCLALLGGVPWFVATEHGFLVIASTIVGVLGVRGFAMACGVLRLIETGRHELAAEATDRSITITLGDQVASLDVHARTLERAGRHAAPTAIVQRS